MGSGAIVSLEEFKQAHIQVEARRQLHERFDQWLDTLEEKMPEEKPTLEQLNQAGFELRQELTSTITETLVEQTHREGLSQETMACPHCGRSLSGRESTCRTVETMVGEIRLTRRYFYCVRCQKGFDPSDKAMQLSQRRKQWDIQKAGVRLATELPYETASELFGQLTGLSLSDYSAHEVVGEVGVGLSVLDVSPPAQEIAQRVASVAEGKTWRPIVVLAVDGADVPTRPESAKGRRPGRGSWCRTVGSRAAGLELRCGRRFCRTRRRRIAACRPLPRPRSRSA